MKLSSFLVPSALITVSILSFGDCQKLQKYGNFDPSNIQKISSALAEAEPRQMGILGFAALGAMMFPILVSLGMASFVSHLPTVFKEFASEFGIPSTPARDFFLFRGKRSDANSDFEDRWQHILKAFHANLVKTLEEKDVLHKNVQRL